MHKESRATIKALLVGPFPPPIGGDTVLTAAIARSRFWADNGITLDCIDTSAKDRVRLPDERIGLGDVTRGIRIAYHVAAKLRHSDIVLLWCNNRFAVTAGLAIVTLSNLSRRPIFVKVFGAYLAKRISGLPAVWRAVACSILRRANCIFAETKALARELEVHLPADRIFFLPNFIAGTAKVELEKEKIFSGKCVFFGQVKREKGVFDIIEALGGCERFSCDFYGPLVERDRISFLDSISRHLNLAYRGIAKPEEVISLAAAYDVLLLPTYHPSEGYPAVILESYSAGVPVVATEWRSIPEIVLDGCTGLLVPIRSPQSIREALEKLKADEVLFNAMRRNAADFVYRFSEEQVVGRMLVPRVLSAAVGARHFRG